MTVHIIFEDNLKISRSMWKFFFSYFFQIMQSADFIAVNRQSRVLDATSIILKKNTPIIVYFRS